MALYIRVMRNNNPDIVIHHLIARTANKGNISYHRFDYSEELALKEKEQEKIRIIHETQISIEEKGHWKPIMFENIKYTILIRAGKDEQKTVNHFIEKLRHRK